MKNMYFVLFVFLLCIQIMPQALAQDCMPHAAVSNPRFDNDAISIEKEIINISNADNGSIVVEFVFKNISSKKQNVNFIFPLPSKKLFEMSVDTYGDSAPRRPEKSELWVNGVKNNSASWRLDYLIDEKPIAINARKYAATLKSCLGWVIPSKNQLKKILTGINSNEFKETYELETLEFCKKLDNITGTSNCEALPKMRSQGSYAWSTTILAGKILKVKQKFSGILGSCRASLFFKAKDFCLSALEFNKLSNQKFKNPAYYGSSTQFFLRVAGQKNRPIRDFTLRIHMNDINDKITTCFKDLKQLSPLIYEMKKRNFTPTCDLAVRWGGVLNHK